MVTTMSRFRIWAPFVIAWVGGTLVVQFESEIGGFLGVRYSPLLGYLMTDVYAGVPIGFVAALASRSWRGLPMYVLGLLTVGLAGGIVSVVIGGVSAGIIVFAPFYFAFLLGVFGVPTYGIVTTVVSFFRWLDSATRWRGPSPRE